MVYDLNMLKSFYTSYKGKMEYVHAALKRPLTLVEETLYARLYNVANLKNYERGGGYVNFRPDRVAIQDATTQVALLQFMSTGKDTAAVPSAVHCNHLIQAYRSAEHDIETAIQTNREVYDFLRDVSPCYGIGFWKPGADIIHRVVLENYAFPDGMMADTDSHTPNAGGLGMIATGVGGADVVDMMTGTEWGLKMPRLIGVRLTGRLNGWTVLKNVILKLAGILTVKGGTNAIIEYFGSGTVSLSAMGKATIRNMGAKVGATTSLFSYDEHMAVYLKAAGHEEVTAMVDSVAADLRAGDEVMARPEDFYNRVIEIDLSELEPCINSPFTLDTATPIPEFAEKVVMDGHPRKTEVDLISPCTSSSYQGISHATSVARQVNEKNLEVASPLTVNLGSGQTCATVECDGMIDVFERMGVTTVTGACGPCTDQWKHHTDDPTCKNSIMTSFDRNSIKRVDGNPNTFVFVASPETALALTVAGDPYFNPLRDRLVNRDGEKVRSSEPTGDKLLPAGFVTGNQGYQAPAGEKVEIRVAPDPQYLQLLTPFPVWDGNDFLNMPLFIKAQGKCTIDHVSMASPWPRFHGHLENIPDNMLIGVMNVFSDETGKVWNRLINIYETILGTAKQYKADDISSVIVAEENYGKGSGREHVAVEPRFLNMKVVLTKSFARIHETNLKKQGTLAATFVDKASHDRIHKHDLVSVVRLKESLSGHDLETILHRESGTGGRFAVQHTYNEQQIG